MQQLLDFLKAHATLSNILLVAASLISLLTVLGNLLKALAPKGSKVAHFADLMLAAAIDIGKAVDALKKLAGGAPPVVGGPIGGPLGAVALVVGLSLAAPARAQVIYSYGATAKLVSIDLKSGTQVGVADGAGLQFALSLKSLQREFAGKLWDLLDLDLMAFGTRVTGPAGQQFGDLAGAIGLGTLSNLIAIGIGTRLGGPPFAVFMFNFNFAGGTIGPAMQTSGSTALRVAQFEPPRANMLFQ